MLIGIAGMWSKREGIAILVGLVASILFYLILPQPLLLTLLIVLIPLTAIALYFELHRGKDRVARRERET
jgi:hypothetical protein